METRPSFFRASTDSGGASAVWPLPQPPDSEEEVAAEAEADSDKEAEAKEDNAAEGHTQRQSQFAPNQRGGDGTINPPFP